MLRRDGRLFNRIESDPFDTSRRIPGEQDAEPYRLTVDTNQRHHDDEDT